MHARLTAGVAGSAAAADRDRDRQHGGGHIGSPPPARPACRAQAHAGHDLTIGTGAS